MAFGKVTIATAVLIVLFTLSIASNAYALSAASYTLKPTFTSLNSGKWSRVWQDSSTLTTYFVDVSTTQIKTERINNADGSINSTATYALPGSGNAAISAIEKVGGVNRVYYVQTVNSTAVAAGIVNIDTGTAVSTATLAMATSGSSFPAIATTKNAVYYFFKDTAGGNIEAYYTGRAFGAVTTITSGLSTGNAGTDKVACDISTDGAATAQDVVYCAVPTTNQPHAYKITSAAVTSLGNIGSAASGTSAGLVSISGKAIVRIVTSGVTYTYTITKSTDTLSSSQYTDTWLTWQNQQYDFDGTTRSYKISSAPYYATTSKALGYDAQTGTLEPLPLYSETMTPGTGTIAGVSSTFYRISDSLIVTGSTTTWTPEVVTASTTLQPTTYSEYLLANLVSNSTIILDGGYVRLACDGNYQYPIASKVLAGDSSDCSQWLTLANPSATVGRTLPYAASKDLVHADTVTGYTFSLSVADPTVYNIATIYKGKTVDSVNFDSSGQAQQRLLYGQCYTMSVTEINTGNSVQSGNVCAGDDTSKTISLTGVTIPSDWLGQTWSHAVTRNFTNPTNNTVLFSVQKSVNPYNASIYVTNNVDTSHATISQWFNFTNASGISIANVTSGVSVNSNQTLWFTVYENGVVVVHDISSGQGFNFGGTFTNLGLLYGLPVAMIFPILVAVVFPKSYAYFGLIVVGAVIGIMQFFGFLNLGNFAWPMAFGLIGIGVVMGVKR